MRTPETLATFGDAGRIPVSVVTEYRLQFRGTLFPIRSGEVILGRSSYASIVVNNPLASREHAVVRTVGGHLEVADLGSKNGTFVNGKRVDGSCAVDIGDLIKIGTDVLEVARASARDPQALRVATEPGRAAGQTVEGDTTVNFNRSLDLAEALVTGCAEANRPTTAEQILRILHEFLSDTDGTLGDVERQRVKSLATVISSWGLGDSIEATRRSLEERLAGMRSGRPG